MYYITMASGRVCHTFILKNTEIIYNHVKKSVRNYCLWNIRNLPRVPQEVSFINVIRKRNSPNSIHSGNPSIAKYSTFPVQGIHEKIPALQMKKIPQRKKRIGSIEEEFRKPGHWPILAYTTAEEYNLEEMTKMLYEKEPYDIKSLQNAFDQTNRKLDLDVIHAVARYPVGSEPREAFIFREGCVVFWNMDELECSNFLSCLRPYEDGSYDELLVQAESEIMSYNYGESKHSYVADDNIYLNMNESTILDKYTFSNAMALSVKLGIWEASLNRFVDSIEFVIEDLKKGNKITMTREEALRKTGELFSLRHLINLSSDLLDTPDFYWDREVQEALYHKTCAYFSIQKRTKVMNEKINHCLELVELLSSHLNDNHHVRLEWMIIILIMVEVGFEMLHFIGH